MAEETKRRVGSVPAYAITNVRKGGSPGEYVVSLTRDGKPAGEVKVRASTHAPAYFSDAKSRKKFEKAG